MIVDKILGDRCWILGITTFFIVVRVLASGWTHAAWRPSNRDLGAEHDPVSYGDDYGVRRR